MIVFLSEVLSVIVSGYDCLCVCGCGCVSELGVSGCPEGLNHLACRPVSELVWL